MKWYNFAFSELSYKELFLLAKERAKRDPRKFEQEVMILNFLLLCK